MLSSARGVSGRRLIDNRVVGNRVMHPPNSRTGGIQELLRFVRPLLNTCQPVVVVIGVRDGVRRVLLRPACERSVVVVNEFEFVCRSDLMPDGIGQLIGGIEGVEVARKRHRRLGCESGVYALRGNLIVKFQG